MKKILNWQVILGIILIALSAFVYYAHYLIFRDVHHIFIYLIGDIGFVFLEVLLVTLIIHQLLTQREKRTLLKKLNMVIGAFFSEVGKELLKMFSDLDKNSPEIAKKLIVTNKWVKKDFLKMHKYLKQYEAKLSCNNEKVEEIKEFLKEKRNFLLNLLENPNLLEHESFTNLLWAVFHLTEEVSSRKDLKNIKEKDLEHIEIDIKRAYKKLISEWLDYMKHLKTDYPYLFSFAMRTNPFDQHVSIEIE